MRDADRIGLLEDHVDALHRKLAEHQTALARANKAIEELAERVSGLREDIREWEEWFRRHMELRP